VTKPVHPTLGKKLRWYRRRAGLSQRDLERLSRIPFSQISAWERGKTTPNYARTAALAKALGVPIEWLWDHTPAPPED